MSWNYRTYRTYRRDQSGLRPRWSEDVAKVYKTRGYWREETLGDVAPRRGGGSGPGARYRGKRAFHPSRRFFRRTTLGAVSSRYAD
jgi:hypothetical protein